MEEIYSKLMAVRNGDKEARDAVISENLGLIWSIVRRFANRGYEMEELFQVGCIGLIKAVDKFDDSYAVKFSTYAVPLIIGEIKRFLRDDGMLHVSRSMKETAVLIKGTIERMQKELGREPTVLELSKELSMDGEEIAMALASSVEVESIHKTIYQKDGNAICLLDRLEQSKASDSVPEDIVDQMVLQTSLNDLPPEDQELIRMRYFQDMTQAQIAKVLGISQVQVSRMEKKILLKLKHMIEG